MKSNKGQAGNEIVTGMITLLMVGMMGLICILVYNNISTSVIPDLGATTSAARMTANNLSDGFFDGMDLSSNIPIVIAAGILLMVIIGFAMYVRS
jgi:hypothetical protein